MLQLVLGNKNYSSWSLRPWMLLKHFNIPFHELHVSLNQESLSAVLRQYSPSCKVPVLMDGTRRVWDSLAICEYVNETYMENQAWPRGSAERAWARSVACEMHSSFAGLRNEMPMNIRAKRVVTPSMQCKLDIGRIDAIWAECMKMNTGPWLFGEYSIADAMFAPVVMRFVTYGVTLSGLAQQYQNNVLEDVHIKEWMVQAKEESEVVNVDEVGVEA